mmetsp:Transcript_46397/g.123014  ORF Transcript_46397/g.123014 Transcript_46397/m.123014 type:complete len:206 (+) Transcript_46397:392-1009(+)
MSSSFLTSPSEPDTSTRLAAYSQDGLQHAHSARSMVQHPRHLHCPPPRHQRTTRLESSSLATWAIWNRDTCETVWPLRRTRAARTSPAPRPSSSTPATSPTIWTPRMGSSGTGGCGPWRTSRPPCPTWWCRATTRARRASTTTPSGSATCPTAPGRSVARPLERPPTTGSTPTMRALSTSWPWTRSSTSSTRSWWNRSSSGSRTT